MRDRDRPPCRWLMGAASALLIVACAGCDASGTTQGGTPVIADRCSDPDLGHTWTDLYDCYFGPSGKTSCVGQSFCHGAPDQTGALFPGAWLCGASREACWQGTRQAPAVPGGVGLVCTNVAAPSDAGMESGAPDAGSDAATGSGALDGGDASSTSSTSDGGASDAGDGGDAGPPPVPVVCVVPTGDPTSTRLWGDLRGATGGVGLHRMPYALPNTNGIAFSQQDLDRISAWIREGAQDN